MLPFRYLNLIRPPLGNRLFWHDWADGSFHTWTALTDGMSVTGSRRLASGPTRVASPPVCSPDGALIVEGRLEGHLHETSADGPDPADSTAAVTRIRDVETGQLRTVDLPGGWRPVSIMPGGSALVCRTWRAGRHELTLFDGRSRTLLRSAFPIEQPLVSPDGRWLATAVRTAASPRARRTITVGLHDGVVRPVTTPGTSGHPAGWSADSRTLAVQVERDDRTTLATVDLPAGQAHPLPDTNRDLTLLAIADDGGALTGALIDAGRLEPAAFSMRSGRWRHGDAVAGRRAADGGDVTWVASPHHSLFAQQDLLSPARLGSAADANVRHRTYLLAGRKVCVLEAGDPDAVPVVMLPGGPGAIVTRQYNPLAAGIVAAGLRVVLPNLSGNSGFGLPHRERIFGDWGGPDLAELIDLLVQLAQPGQRPALFGQSYGAYLALLAATSSPASLSSVVAWAPVVDLTDFWTEVPSARLLLFDHGLVPSRLTRLTDRSPLRRRYELRAPTLLIHGDDDVVVPWTASLSRMAGHLAATAGHRVERISKLAHFTFDLDQLTELGELVEQWIKRHC